MSQFPTAARIRDAFTRGSAIARESFAMSSGCRITNPDHSREWSVEARVPLRISRRRADEGGFIPEAPAVAAVLKRPDFTPDQSWFFYDGQKWFRIQAVTTADHLPEWHLELAPAAGS